MNKKLLNKTLRAYLTFSVLLLVVSAPLFYYITERLYIQETDETLLLHKNEFIRYSLLTLKIDEISNWNKCNRNVKIQAIQNTSKDTIFYTSYYDTLEAEVEPYRELNALVLIQDKPYVYVARINLVETKDLIKSIVFLFVAMIAVLLTGLFFITKRMSQKIWGPFYETLRQMEGFEIDKSKQPHFVETDIEEFGRLNQSIEKLIHKNIAIYKNQREFIENAAHELQTPLAIFQAKIDTLMQRSDVTKGQSLILNSLNESVFRLNRLNKNLLLLSKMENEHYSEKQTISLNEYIERHIDFFVEQAKAKNSTLETVLPVSVVVYSNPILLEVFINNLLLNAIKHNEINGKITVTLSRNSLVFSNTAKGLALDSETMFNRFSKTNPSEQGTGLGLSIVKKIADINRWTISYKFSEKLHSFSVSF